MSLFKTLKTILTSPSLPFIYCGTSKMPNKLNNKLDWHDNFPWNEAPFPRSCVGAVDWDHSLVTRGCSFKLVLSS